MSALIFDTETTGSTEPVRIVQAAWIELDDTLQAIKTVNLYFNPDRPIDSGAMAVHGLMGPELKDKPLYDTFHLPETDFIIGHNIDYDWEQAGSPEHVKRICTLALARKLWPDADSHQLLALCYRLAPEKAKILHKMAHNARYDVALNLIVLHAIANEMGLHSAETLWEASEQARIPDVMPFGKHKGAKIADLPRDYVQWMLGQKDLDPYLRTALERRLSPTPPRFNVPEHTLPF